MFFFGFFDNLLKITFAQLQQFAANVAEIDGFSLLLLVFSGLVCAGIVAYSFLLYFGRQTLENARDRLTGLTLREITEVLPTRVCYIDANGILLYCNRPGYEEFYGQRLADKLRSKDRHVYQCYFEACLAGEPMRIEMESVFDGKSIEDIRFLPHRSSKGKILGVICITNDVSSYRIIEKELSAAKEAADLANAAKSAFLANMSHEIRTPLSAVLGFSDLLIKNNIAPDQKQVYIKAIQRNGILLKALVDDILDLTKVEAGKIDLEMQTMSLQDLIEDIMSYLEIQAMSRSTKLLIFAAEGLPKRIRSDPMRLRQILINIIGNAIKFTPGGTVEVLIEMRTSEELVFVVKDNGVGISPDQAKGLFHAFQQGDASINSQFGGTGLGLVLSRRFARLLGGDVKLIESEMDKGSVFQISIDVSSLINEGDMDLAAEELTPHFVQAKELSGLHILLTEDALDNQLLIGTYLDIAGASYDLANNGLDALNRVSLTTYDLVLLDIQMPIMDGYTAAAELRLRGFKMPLIALTAHTMQEERDRCLAVGFNEHLPKPIDPKVLVQAIKRLTAKQFSLQKNLLLHSPVTQTKPIL